MALGLPQVFIETTQRRTAVAVYLSSRLTSFSAGGRLGVGAAEGAGAPWPRTVSGMKSPRVL
jgi:hypothetical protein